jgi:hypothetical protein
VFRHGADLGSGADAWALNRKEAVLLGSYLFVISKDGDEWMARLHLRGRGTVGCWRDRDWGFIRSVVALAPVYLVLKFGRPQDYAAFIGPPVSSRVLLAE